MELTELCQELKNWFDLKRYFGEFTISNGSISVPDLKENQYFRIIGSVFNDGVHKYPANDLIDETFDGAVWAMAVPPQVIALLKKINDFEDKYGEAIKSPYTSESFGGYSYSKSAGTSADGSGNASNGVLSAFAGELNRWRKV